MCARSTGVVNLTFQWLRASFKAWQHMGIRPASLTTVEVNRLDQYGIS